MRPEGFVELGRTFTDFNEDADPEHTAAHNYMLFRLTGKATDWKQVLKSPCVVVLAEAGSGKTWELLAQATRVHEAGGVSFFVRLENLARASLEECLQPDDRLSLAQWRAGTGEATFFLDAVDESKLSTTHAVEAALRSYIAGVGAGNRRRLRTVISSRITGWRAKEDRAAVKRALDLPEGDVRVAAPTDEDAEDNPDGNRQDTVPAIRVVTMDALSPEQVGVLAQARLQAGWDAFVQEIEEHDVWTFARRPQDVGRLADYWAATGTFGNLTDLIEHDIQLRLRETDDERQIAGAIADADLRRGSEALAAAVIFGKSFSIALENAPDETAPGPSVSPSHELADWNAVARRDLLTRGVFDPAAFGLVRFHHRSIAEYLAAAWLDRLISAHDLPVSDVLPLFFAHSHGVEVLIPSRASLACWLACGDQVWNQRIRQRVLEVSPDAFLAYGDPARLPLDVRVDLLRGVISRLGVEGNDRIDADNDQLKRLADPELEPVITMLVSGADTPTEGRYILLRLVREGRLSGCADAALALLLANPDDMAIAPYAAAAVAHAGNAEHHVRLVRGLLALDRLNPTVVAGVVQVLYPRAVTPEELVGMLERATGRRANREAYLVSSAEKAINERTSDQNTLLVLSGLVELLSRLPGVTINGEKSILISAAHIWALPILVAAIARAFHLKTISSQMEDVLVDALDLLSTAERLGTRNRHNEPDIQALSLRHPSVRRAFSWRRARQLRLWNLDERVHLHTLLGYPGPLEPREEDLHWILSDLSHERPLDDRRMALWWASSTWWQAGSPADKRKQVWKLINDDPGLRRLYRDQFKPPLVRWVMRTKGRIDSFRRWGWRKPWHSVTEFYWRPRDWLHLLCNLRGISNGINLGHLIWLFRRSHNDSVDHGGHEEITRLFGRWIGTAYLRGCIATWRTFIPPLIDEKGDGTPWATVIGTYGLLSDLENGLDLTRLLPADATRAARYLAEERHKFPDDLLPELARLHPNEVSAVLRQCVTYDWRQTEESHRRSGMFWELVSGPPSVRRLIAPHLLDMLRERDPQRGETLLQGVSIILHSIPDARAEISALARDRTTNLDLDSNLLLTWAIIWLWLDGEAAVTWLEQLPEAHDRADVERLFLNMGDYLKRDDLNPKPFDDEPSFCQVQPLCRFVRLVYEYIKPEDDLDRSGGPYTPTTRDHAERFRDSLLSKLAGTPGVEAYRALLLMADDPRLARSRTYVLRAATKRSKLDSEPERWRPGDARQYAQTHELPVRSGHDLFAATRCWFRCLRDDLQDADFKLREGLPVGENEARLQEWIARDLERRANRRTAVHREVMVADGRMPDVRLETAPYLPTSIEMKWAEDWSYNQLLEALRDQLVGRYMRARRSRHGVLLLCSRGTARRWQPPGEPEIDFAELVRRLGAEADALRDADFEIDNLVIEELMIA